MTLLKKNLCCFLFSLIISSSSFIYSQNALIEEVNFDLIPYKTVKTYIHEQVKMNIISFSDIKPSWKNIQNQVAYHTQEKTYLIKENLSKVWEKYRTTSPAKSWNGKKVMFGFMFEKNNNTPIYCGDEKTEIDTGQVIFLNLKLLKFYNLAMAFEVISIDTDKKIMEFSYIEGNISQGKQSLQFIDTPEGYTKIIHSSVFKSDSKMRDKFLYPFFHTRTTNEFHRIMKRIITES
jgi:hypothetical protein